MLLPIIMICVCALLGGGTLIFLKLSAKHKKSKNKDKEELAQITANEFVNVKDIRGNFLYTRDNLALAYLKIYPISTELFSKNEKRLIAKQLTVSLSSAPVSASCCIPPGRYFSAVVGAICHTHFFFRCKAKGTAEAGNRGNGRLCSFRRGCGTAILHQDLG